MWILVRLATKKQTWGKAGSKCVVTSRREDGKFFQFFSNFFPARKGLTLGAATGQVYTSFFLGGVYHSCAVAQFFSPNTTAVTEQAGDLRYAVPLLTSI